MPSQPAVIFGGPSPEHDISVLTGLQAARVLARSGQAPIALYWSKAGDWFEVDAGLEGQDFVDGTPRGATAVRLGVPGGFTASGRLGRERALGIDAALICCHGGPGEDGALQGALDLAGVAYTGPTARGAALGMDKLAFGAVVAGAGLPTLPRVAVLPGADAPDFDAPFIIKPRFGGSSIGIEVVADWETALALTASSVHLRAGAVAEPFREGAVDIDIAIRTHPDLALSAISRPLRPEGQAAIFDYRSKYVGGEGMASAPRELPAALPEAVAGQIREAAVTTARVAGLRGMARLDFLLTGQELVVNEVNTVPGSLSYYLWVEPPISFEHLLTDLLDEARACPTRHDTAAGADGTALRSAGTIASKLA